MTTPFLRRGAAPAAALLVLSLAACSSAASPEAGESASASETAAAVDGGAITVGQTADILSIDPVIDNSLAGINVFYNLYDQLTMIEPDGSVGSRIATEWTANEDSTVWEYTLRDDITFHDGSPLTAEDIIYTYEQVQTNPQSLNSVYLADLESMEAVDDSTLRFTLSRPYANWPRNTTLISIVPSDYYEAVGGSDGFTQAPVGSGPFEFVSYTPGVSVVLEAADTYWGEEASLDQVTFVPVLTDEGRVSGTQAGDLDIALLPPTQVSTLEGSGMVDVRSITSNQTMYLGFNTESGPLADPLIRQAADAAVDRQAIIDTLLGGLGSPAGQMSAPSSFGYTDAIEPTAYDPAAATALLDEAGYSGETVKLQYAMDGWIPLGSQVAQAVAGYLEAAGFTVELEGMDSASLSLLNSNHGYEGVWLAAFAPSILDAGIVLDYVIGPRANRYFASDEVDDLYFAQQAAADDAERAEAIAGIYQIVKDEAFTAPLYNPQFSYGVNPALHWEPRPDGAFVLNGDVYLTQ